MESILVYDLGVKNKTKKGYKIDANFDYIIEAFWISIIEWDESYFGPSKKVAKQATFERFKRGV